MKIEFIAAADPKKVAGVDAEKPAHIPVFVVDYPKSGPVLESSFIFPKIESYGVWKISAPSRADTIPAHK